MSAVPFRQGREGLYANLGAHTVLISRRRTGYVVLLDGTIREEGLAFPQAQREAQVIARGIRASLIAEGDGSDPYDVAEGSTTTNHTKENEMTSTTITEGEKAFSEATGITMATEAPKPAQKPKAKAATKKRAPRPAARPKATVPKKDTREQVRYGFAQGTSVADMAKNLGISQGRVRQILMDSGLVKPASRNPERDARIVAAIDAGESAAVVAEREGVKEFRARWIHKVAKAGAA